jgi:hypothetical protein
LIAVCQFWSEAIPAKPTVDANQQINYRSVELLIGQDMMVRTYSNVRKTILYFPEFTLASLRCLVHLTAMRKFLTESLILAQDERWRRA